MADGLATVVTDASGHVDLPDRTLSQHFGSPANVTEASALMARLNDSPVLPGCLDDLAAFPHVMADGFFEVHVLSRLTGPNGGQGMPVVARCNCHDIDAFI